MDIVTVSATTTKLKMVVYGEPGAGKTVLSSTAPKPLFLDLEGGLMSVADKKVDAVRITSWNDVKEAFKYLSSVDHKYSTVVIDSITELTALCLAQVVEESMQVKRKKSPDDVYLEDYGKTTIRMRALIRSFRDLNTHVVFTALPKVSEDGNETFITPSLTPKVSNFLMAMVDVVGFLYADDDGNRKLLVQPKGKWVAKDRSGRLGDVIPSPNMAKIIKTIGGNK